MPVPWLAIEVIPTCGFPYARISHRRIWKIRARFARPTVGGVSCKPLNQQAKCLDGGEPRPMKVVVCHSGGLDSSVCVIRALNQGHELLSLGFNYGQRARIELRYAKNLCDRFGVERKVFRVPRWSRPPRETHRDRDIEEIRQRPSRGFLPGRNAIFMCLAVTEAIGRDADEVWLGLNCIDSPGYPDCQPAFVEAFERMMTVGTDHPIAIRAPLMDLSKPNIAAEAREYGLTRDDVWSCYRPRRKRGGSYERCNSCDGCGVSNHAWEMIV